MKDKMTQFNEANLKNITTNINTGDTVRVHQIIESGEKGTKTQVFEGIVLAHKHGLEPGATITVRKVVDGIGVERILPLHSPLIKQIEVVKKGKTKRAKLYYLRGAKGKRSRIKADLVQENMFEEMAEELGLEKKGPKEEK